MRRVSKDWLTLPEAANRLGVATSTARRWIREGKLHAEKQPGPYGPEYRIPVDQITTAQEIKDVVRVDHPVDLAHLATVLDRHLADREGALWERMDTLRTELVILTTAQNEGIEALTSLVREGGQRQEAAVAAVRSEVVAALSGLIGEGLQRQHEEIADLRSDLDRTREELRRALAAAQPPWWRRLWPW